MVTNFLTWLRPTAWNYHRTIYVYDNTISSPKWHYLSSVTPDATHSLVWILCKLTASSFYNGRANSLFFLSRVSTLTQQFCPSVDRSVCLSVTFQHLSIYKTVCQPLLGLLVLVSDLLILLYMWSHEPERNLVSVALVLLDPRPGTVYRLSSILLLTLLLLNLNLKLNFLLVHIAMHWQYFCSAPGRFCRAALYKFFYCIVLYCIGGASRRCAIQIHYFTFFTFYENFVEIKVKDTPLYTTV